MALDTKTPDARGRGRSPSAAALLSFVWPGLGQFYTGRRRAAAIFAVPALLITLLIVFQIVQQGAIVFAARLATVRSYGLITVAMLLLVGVLRLVSVGHAFAAGDTRRNHRLADRLVVIALGSVIVVSHATAGAYLLVASNAVVQATTPNDSLIVQATPLPSGQTPAPTISLAPATPVPIDSRVTILLTGVDSDPKRTETLYDSIMVVSYDPKTNSVQMISVPRDSASFPLYFGGQVKVTTRINALPTYVRNGWVASPDAPYITLVKEISYLVGIPINYYAVMDLAGFVRMIDMVGGIDVNNPAQITDPGYDWLDETPRGFYLARGPQHLSGRDALAYVRSRHGTSNNDWKRASRQQEVMVALLRKMSDPVKILSLPEIISTLGSSVSTTFPADRIADYVAIGQSIPKENFRQVVLGPPYTIINVNNETKASTTCLLNYKVAQLSIEMFGKDSLWYGKKSPANTCP
jgi:LCP family protein required for cell wall assembly